MTAINGIFSDSPTDNTYSLGPDYLFQYLPTLSGVDYVHAWDRTTSGSNTVQYLNDSTQEQPVVNPNDDINYAGMTAEEQKENLAGSKVNVAKSLDALASKVAEKKDQADIDKKVAVLKGQGILTNSIRQSLGLHRNRINRLERKIDRQKKYIKRDNEFLNKASQLKKNKSRYLKNRNKIIFGSGKSEPGIPVHRQNVHKYPGPKHVIAHDPAHRLRSNYMHIRSQNS